MSSFSRFQKRNGAYKTETNERVNSHFIMKGYPSIQINGTSGEKVQAAVHSRQEKDEGYIYTYKNSPLLIGSVWEAKGLHLLVDEEIIVIKDVDWHKYHCLLCNVDIDGNWGYFLGPEKKHVDVQLKEEVFLFSQQKPVLVLAGQPLKFQDKVMIKNRAWLVEEFDSISTDGITYYSLTPTTMSKEVIEEHKDEPAFVEEYVEPILQVQEEEQHEEVTLVNTGARITISTEGGYFKSSTNALKVLRHTGKLVEFEIPFGITDFTIEYKEEGDICQRQYQVVN